MKSTHVYAIASILLTTSLALLVGVGCGGSDKAQSNSGKTSRSSAPQAQISVPAMEGGPAVDSTFDEVAQHLNAGGNFYMYLSTENAMTRLLATLASFENLLVQQIPDPTEAQKVKNGMDLARSFVQTSGLQELSGIGASSFPMTENITHSKFVLYHAPGQDKGKLWQLLGRQPHSLDTLAMMPEDTVLAGYIDLDLNLGIQWLRNLAESSNIPELAQVVAEFDRQSQQAGLNINEILNSTDGGFGFAIQFSQTQTISVPIGTEMQIPSPSFFLFTRVKDDGLYKRIDALAKQRVEGMMPLTRDVKEGNQMLMVPQPLFFGLQPAVLQTSAYLFIGSHPGVLQKVAAVSNGASQSKTLRDTDEFKLLSRNIPQVGNQWFYTSRRFGDTVQKVQARIIEQQQQMRQQQQQAGATTTPPPDSKSWADMMEKFNRSVSSLGVIQVTDEGIIAYSNTRIE